MQSEGERIQSLVDTFRGGGGRIHFLVGRIQSLLERIHCGGGDTLFGRKDTLGGE